MENKIYSDPNAFVKLQVEKPKQKVDMMHIEKVMYPVNYNEFTTHFDNTCFENKKEDLPSRKNNNFDISKLLPLLAGGKGSLDSMLPTLLSGLGVSKDVLPFLNNFTNINKPKKVEAKVIKFENGDSISKYRKVRE